MTTFKSGKNRVTFLNKTIAGDLTLVGDLYLPPNFNDNTKYPTIVFTGPLIQVKEQMGANYGEKLAKKGFVFLSFDHAGLGESEGVIRGYEHTPTKIDGLSDAVSYLSTLKFVDPDKMYGLGACAGANTMAYFVLTDKRIKKVAFVSGMLANATIFHRLTNKDKVHQDFLNSNMARQRAYVSGQIEEFDVLGVEAGKNAKPNTDVGDGYDYYMTERAGKETFPGYTHIGPEFYFEDFARYNAHAIAGYIKQPTLVIYGSKAMTRFFSLMFYAKKRGPKKRVVIKGARHVCLYDRDIYVDQAVDAIANYFR